MKKLLFILFSLFALPVAATTPSKPAEKVTLEEVTEYLNKLTTIEAEFLQVGPDGELTGGKFYLSRPGKMRWEYDPPTPILMVSDGREFIYYDKDLHQVTHIPLVGSLSGFIARDHISFDDAIELQEFEEKDGVIRITVRQKEKPDEGSLQLEFSTNPVLLRSFTITDAIRNVTTVSLNNARFGGAIDKGLFKFADPTIDRRKQRQGGGGGTVLN